MFNRFQNNYPAKLKISSFFYVRFEITDPDQMIQVNTHVFSHKSTDALIKTFKRVRKKMESQLKTNIVNLEMNGSGWRYDENLSMKRNLYKA